MELVSIIVPIYKVEKYIHQCINSIINQTYKNLEIILVDDGSPDSCGQICDEYAQKDMRIKVIHQKNGGLSAARNAGLDMAKGTFISFIDSDDFVADNFIEVLYDLCINNNADIAECDFMKFNEKVLHQSILEEKNIYNHIEMINRIYDDQFITRTIVVWNKLYKRSIYENLRFPVGKINEDEFTTYKAFYNCSTSIVTTNLPLYYYRVHDNSIMGEKFSIKRLDLLEALKEQTSFYKENGENELYAKSAYKYQCILKKYYILTKENIENPNLYLKNIKKNMILNINAYLNLKDVSKKNKMKMCLFSFFPKIYCNIIKGIGIVSKQKEMSHSS